MTSAVGSDVTSASPSGVHGGLSRPGGRVPRRSCAALIFARASAGLVRPFSFRRMASRRLPVIPQARECERPAVLQVEVPGQLLARLASPLVITVRENQAAAFLERRPEGRLVSTVSPRGIDTLLANLWVF